MNEGKTYIILTDGEVAFKGGLFTKKEFKEMDKKAREESDGNLWWQPDDITIPIDKDFVEI